MARFPFTRQHDGMQCGVACMSMICRHYDKTFSISRLEKSCHVTKEGVSLKAIRDLCEEIGLDSAAGKVTVANLADTPLPCVLHWNQNHFVVLYKTDRNGSRFWIADPGKGKYKCSIEDMERHWVSTQSQGKEKGIAMFFEPTEKFSKNSCNPKGESRSFRFLWGYIMQYKRYFLQILLGLLTGSAVYALWITRFLQRRKVLDYELFEQQAANQNRTVQFVTSMQEIKLQDCEQRRRWEWEDTQADLFDVQMKSLRLQQTQEAGSIFINEVKNILITVFAATAVIDGHITLGAMLAIQYIVGQLNSPVDQLMAFVYSLQDVKISLERINEIHEAENEDKATNCVEQFKGEHSITISNVSFKYDRHALKNTLEDVSFHIPAGKVTAIVGASGCGKTTLIKLMLGYYPVAKGCIEIADAPIDTYNLKWLRRHCGVVMQDGVIFSESIARNIAVDDGEIDTERLESAARIACIHDYVSSLPLKYNTKIGHDGNGLSQGQKQRILIARAVYKDPDFIFLDEATNALDAKNERKIVENLEQFYKGKTVVVVAHRLSTVKNADNIIVVDDGKVVESGRHEELTAAKGAYYNLVKNQLELGN